jgi:predicted RNase H-like nuclease (RuvC/YqgF family)
VGTRRKTQLLGRVDGLLAELRQLRAENRQLRASHAKAVKTIEQMAAANDRLAATIEEQNRTIASLEAHLRSARGLAADAPTVPSAQVPVYLKPPSRAGSRR